MISLSVDCGQARSRRVEGKMFREVIDCFGEKLTWDLKPKAFYEGVLALDERTQTYYLQTEGSPNLGSLDPTTTFSMTNVVNERGEIVRREAA